MDGFFTISANPNLSGLGLDSLESVGYNFIVKDNHSLCTAIAEELADDISVGGEVIIAGNKECL